MTTLHHRRLTTAALLELLNLDAPSPLELDAEQRDALAQRFRSVAVLDRRRLDAWSVEHAGAPQRHFVWSAATARRSIGHRALARWRRDSSTSLTQVVRDEIDELLVRAASGYARGGSLAHWLARQPRAVLGLVTADAVTWVSELVDLLDPLDVEWEVPDTDAYYDVAGAQTSLRARRDIVIPTATGRVLLRTRGGLPGRSAGPGLRTDLVIEALSHPHGVVAERCIGVWPDAGIALAVDGTLEDLRAGARDLVRTAVAQARHRPRIAA